MKNEIKKNNCFRSLLNRPILVLLILILFSVISFAVGFSMSSTPIAGAFPVYSGSGDIWNPSGETDSGVLIIGNTLCFPTTSSQCDNNITWNGTDFIING